MAGFVPYEKLSKKKKRERDRVRRGSWGEINPVTRRAKNEKAYNRKKSREWIGYPDGGTFFVLPQPRPCAY